MMGRSFDDFVATLDSLGHGWVVLLSDPTTSWFARYDGVWSGAPSAVLAACDVGLPAHGFPSDVRWPRFVFEARAADGEREVRWVKGLGTAVLPSPSGPSRLQHRLVLGEGTGEGQDGWSVLRSSRVGSYPFPAVVGAGERGTLNVLELTNVDRHGNVAVTDEVLVGPGSWPGAVRGTR